MLPGMRSTDRAPVPAWADGWPLDHVAVAVPDLGAAAAAFDVLGLPTAGPDEEVGSQGVRVRMLRAGPTRIELIAPLGAEGAVARFLQRRGAGLHHIAFRVPDLGATLARLREAGVELIDDRPRPGHGGSRVAFVHPRSCAGVLVELVEHVTEGQGG